MLYNFFQKNKIIFNKYGLLEQKKNVKDIYYLNKYQYKMSTLGANGFCLDKVINKNISKFLYLYLHAEFYFYKGCFDISEGFLKEAIEENSLHVQSYYLLSEIYLKKNKPKEAQNILYEIFNFSDRKKTWLYLSRSIRDLGDFLRFKNTFNELLINKEKEINYEVASYYSDAAMKLNLYEEAFGIWKNNTKIKNKKIKKNSFNAHDAHDALIHLRETLGYENFFLVSGTLLGIVRDNKILEHDKDLDIGVFEKDIENLVGKIEKSGYFEILPTRTKYQIKLKHFNGIYIDIFIHTEDDKFYWHYTSKIKWYNERFNLINHCYAGRLFKIPENYNKYLIENYGKNWLIPIKNFDSTFDTPNAVIYNNSEMELFLLKKSYIVNI